jgi:hypothetical protein
MMAKLMVDVMKLKATHSSTAITFTSTTSCCCELEDFFLALGRDSPIVKHYS